jgi:hypothetical protein
MTPRAVRVTVAFTYPATFTMTSRDAGTLIARTTAQKTTHPTGNFFLFDISMIVSRGNSALKKSWSADLRLTGLQQHYVHDRDILAEIIRIIRDT